MGNFIFKCLILNLAMLPAYAAEATFLLPGISATCASILFRGEIRPGDAKALSSLIANNEVGCVGEDIAPGIAFDSSGGDLDEAMRIGRLIRSKGIGTWVSKGAKCVSACNIAFLGGVSRSVDGAFGIHRPYTLTLSIDKYEALSKYDAITRALISYANEMRVSQELFDRMMKISPQDVHFLNYEEMQTLGVTGIDAVWEDISMSKEANSIGISKQEYIRRRAYAKEMCGKGLRPYPDTCFDSIMKTGRLP